MDRSAARDQEPRRRRRWHRRRRHFGRAADPEPVDLSRGDRAGVPRRLGPRNPLFKTSQRSDLSYVGHLRGYQDITESTNIDLGFSYSQRPQRPASAIGVGSPVASRPSCSASTPRIRWRPLQRSIYHSFIGRTEVDLEPARPARRAAERRRDVCLRRLPVRAALVRRRALRPLATAPTMPRCSIPGGSLILTYWPSEFSQVRGAVPADELRGGPTANEFLFQFQFSIGAHGAHPF